MSTTAEEFETKVRRESIAQSISFKIDYDELNFGKELGSGGSGIVYQGMHVHGVVAIKKILSNNLSPEARREFHAESQIMAGLHSPHIVQFYGYCLNPQYCIVMEYMRHGSLYNLLQNTEQPLDWPMRLRMASDISSGLAFLHQKNILHRDIKSLNVLLTESLGAKLTDFGLSKVKNETKTHLLTTKTKDFVSTIPWMAPELFKHGISYTKKSDIYSLGITLWEIATRKTPFMGADPTLVRKWVKKGTRERDEIPADCPSKLISLIEACWVASPDDRPSADAVAIYLKSDANDFKEFLSSNKNNLSFALANTVNNLQVDSPVSLIPKLNLSEQNNPPMLTQFQHFPKVNAAATASNQNPRSNLPLSYVEEDDEGARYKTKPKPAIGGAHVLNQSSSEPDADKANYKTKPKPATTDTSPPSSEGLIFSSKAAQRALKLGDNCCKGKDYKKAVEWYTQAAEQGSAEAQCKLGDYYYQSDDIAYGVEPDYVQAIKWYAQAATQNFPAAYRMLGDCYYRGFGVGQDYAKAMEHYELAADLGDLDALNNMGNAYEKGRLGQIELKKAAECYTKAATAGYSESQFNLGRCYRLGKGVTQNLDQAKYWYTQAAEQGNSNAEEALRKLGLNFTALQRQAV